MSRFPGPPRLRVLVADDCVELALVTAALLRSWGHQAEVAHDGPTALRAALAWRPDLVLLDIGLPGLSGLEVARRLRRHPAPARTLLAAMTGCEADSLPGGAGEWDFDTHLLKPFDPETLRELLALCGEGAGRFACW